MPRFAIDTRLQFNSQGPIDGMRRSMDRAARSNAEVILSDAQGIVPVDTGNLRDSGRVFRVEPRVYDVAFLADYAGFVEFGWTTVNGKLVPAQPYLRPAIAQNEQNTLRTFGQAAREVTRRDYV